MDRRTFLALFLTALVIVFTPMIFRGVNGRRPLPPSAPADSSTARSTAAQPARPPQAETATTATPPVATAAPSSTPRPGSDTTSVSAGKTRYVFNATGAAPRSIAL